MARNLTAIDTCQKRIISLEFLASEKYSYFQLLLKFHQSFFGAGAKMKIQVIFSAFYFCLALISSAATYYIPDDFAAIQGAISDPGVVDGDFIIVRPGIYAETINFLGKSLTLESESGPQPTVLIGNGLDAVIDLSGCANPAARVEGFTITNGRKGIFWTDWNAHPIIKGNIITNNEQGICCVEGGPPDLIEGNTISYNTIGGIEMLGPMDGRSGVGIQANIIAFNGSGGVSYGGGIHILNYNYIAIDRNVIIGNHSNFGGGGVSCGHELGGMLASFTGNLVAFNSAGHQGGGINLSGYGGSKFVNNTIHGNSAPDGGGIYCSSSMAILSLTIANSIFWGNSASNGASLYLNRFDASLRYSDVDDGLESVHVKDGTVYWGDGMIDADPMFMDVVNGDYHLLFHSPCRNTGDNGAVTELLDFEGDPRIANGKVDMGADEFYRHFYLTGDNTPGGSIEGKLVGLPGTNPLVLIFGSGVLETPFNTMWGPYWLQAPWVLVPLIPLQIPADGILVIPATIPMDPAAPYDLPMQALIGLSPDSMSNLEVLEVR